MKAYEGVLERIGSGSWQNGVNHISVLKIGEKILSSIYVDDRIYSFLDVGSPMSLYVSKRWLGKKWIIGVSHDGGDSICIRFIDFIGLFVGFTITWVFLGALVWLAIYLGLGMSFCRIPEGDAYDMCLIKNGAIGGAIVVGYYIFSIVGLIKDYILVKGLTILRK